MSRRPRPSLKPRSRGTRPVMYSNSWPALWACIPHATISDAAPLTSELKKNKPVRAKFCQGQILALTSAIVGVEIFETFRVVSAGRTCGGITTSCFILRRRDGRFSGWKKRPESLCRLPRPNLTPLTPHPKPQATPDAPHAGYTPSTPNPQPETRSPRP